MNPENRRVAPIPEERTPAWGPPAPPPAGPTLGRVLRGIVGVALIAGASAAVAWVARRHVLRSPRFAVTAIEVTGGVQRTPAAVVAESGLQPGVNVFTADLNAARARILADPWIADATLVRRLPSTILVKISERRAAGLVALGDTYLASPEGEPFKKVEPEDSVDLPLLTGLRPEQFAADREGAARNVRRAMDLAAEYERGGLARRLPLQEVHVEPDGTFSLIVGHGGVQLVLGTPPFRRKLDQAGRVVAELDRRGAKPDVILLDNDARPERVVVRMR